MSIPLKAMIVLVLALAVGCASHPPRVNCEGHLLPINAPAHAKPTTTVP